MAIIIGIDPDLRKSGVCVLDSTGEIMILESQNINELIQLIDWNLDAVYAVEDVNKNKATFSRGRQSQAQISKIAQNVGMVKGAATLIVDIIEHKTGKKVLLAPLGLGKQVKNNAAMFRCLSGYQGQTNEDKRDAWAIAKWAENQIKVKQ